MFDLLCCYLIVLCFVWLFALFIIGCLVVFSCVWVAELVRNVVLFTICVFVILFAVVSGLNLRLIVAMVCALFDCWFMFCSVSLYLFDLFVVWFCVVGCLVCLLVVLRFDGCLCLVVLFGVYNLSLRLCFLCWLSVCLFVVALLFVGLSACLFICFDCYIVGLFVMVQDG